MEENPKSRFVQQLNLHKMTFLNGGTTLTVFGDDTEEFAKEIEAELS